LNSVTKNEITEEMVFEFNLLLNQIKLFLSYANRYGISQFIKTANRLETDYKLSSQNRVSQNGYKWMQHDMGGLCDAQFIKRFILFADMLRHKEDSRITHILSTLFSEGEHENHEAFRILADYMKRLSNAATKAGNVNAHIE
jgi:hypothetical protein